MNARKILLLLNNLDIGGAQYYCLTLAKTLKDRGHEVTVAAGQGALYEEFRRSASCVYIADTWAGYRNDSSSLFNYIYQLLRNFIPAIFKVLNICAKNRFDIIIAQQPSNIFLGSIISCIYKIPEVCLVHSIQRNEFPPLFYPFVKCKNLKYLAVSGEVRDYISEITNTDKSKIEILTNPLELVNYSPSKVGAVKEKREKRVLCVSNINRLKGELIRLFIESALIVHKEIKNIKFELVGSGEKLSYFKNLADEINRKAEKEIIVLHGGKKNVPEFMKCTDVFIGVARGVREAMAIGLPAIVAGHVIGKYGGNYGGIVDSRNIEELEYYNLTGRNSAVKATPDMLADDIKKILKNDAYVGELREFYSNYIEETSSSEKVCDKMESIIDKIIG